MHFGESLTEERFISLIQLAYESGVRTFVTSDVYGVGRADQILGQALRGIDRNTYCLVGMLGHDIYEGKRQGSKGYPRFSDPSLRSPKEYSSFLKMAAEKSLENCSTDKFDLVMLHNPDERGYSDPLLWEAMSELKEFGLTDMLGIAPGPANGFTLDLIYNFEEFGNLIDWAMIILNPLEPWPGRLCLKAAEKADINILTRVVDYGGIFHGTMTANHNFREGDHRTYRPTGWVERGLERVEKMRPILSKYNLSELHFSCLWNLAHGPVRSVVPTFIQEAGEEAKAIEELVKEFGSLQINSPFSDEEIEEIASIGDNTGCMMLKGASNRHVESLRPDEWPMKPELMELAERHGLGSEW
jgi:aryl-alcohol dehydrogenase-like predicted oxidoreductase